MKTGTPEYQYHLKDHLGNVRLTFTTKITQQQVTATFESSSQATEAQNFQNYPSGSGINNVSTFNHTTGGTSSQYLNGGYMGMVGIGKSYSVMAGDQLQIQAYAKYVTHTGSSDIAAFANALLTAFLGSTTVGVDGTPSYALNKWGSGEASLYGDGSSDETDPRVFVTILLFDRNYNFLDVAYQQLASTSGWGSLTASYTVKQAGYAYMYVSNEQQVLTDVYFDDVTMTFTPSAVVQQEDFYPFGLTFNTYQRQNSLVNNFQFNGKELQNDLSLDWLDYIARQYDPAIGRFLNIDPAADLMRRFSVYAYSYDNPIGFTDPDGMIPDDFNEKDKKDDFYNLYHLNKNEPDDRSSVEKYFDRKGNDDNDNSRFHKGGKMIIGDRDGVGKEKKGGTLGPGNPIMPFAVTKWVVDKTISGVSGLIQVGSTIVMSITSAIANGGEYKAPVNDPYAKSYKLDADGKVITQKLYNDTAPPPAEVSKELIKNTVGTLTGVMAPGSEAVGKTGNIIFDQVIGFFVSTAVTAPVDAAVEKAVKQTSADNK